MDVDLVELGEDLRSCPLGSVVGGAAASEIRLLSWASSFASSVLSFLVSCRLSGTVRRSALAHFRW